MNTNKIMMLFQYPFGSMERKARMETSPLGPAALYRGERKWIILFFLALLCQDILGEDQNLQNHTVLQEKINDLPCKKRPTRRRHPNRMVSFFFDNEDLVDIINFLASEREVNVVLPMGANAINAKITLHLEDKISVEEAWDILYTLLDIAGYSMVAKEDTYNIVKTSKDIHRDALPLYIVKPEEIPNTDKRIRYLYYLTNIKIADENQGDIVTILKDVLPSEPSTGPNVPGAWYKLDAQANSILISDKANNIRAVMNIVTALDQVEAQEKPEIIQLRYQNADVIANLFSNDLLRTAGDANQQRLGIRTPNNSTYFKKVRLVPDMRTNRLIVFGRPQAVERVRDFIHKYIDVELESGKSILHVYQLQYLDAQKFAPILKNILQSGKTGGTEQSKGAATNIGTERFFDGVIVIADQPQTISGEMPSGAFQGSNNLIIAARNDDYERIKKLIEQLDIPQPQVIIEVLIADLTIQDIASLGANVRNPLNSGLPSNVNFQSAQTSDFLTNTVRNPTTIQADLLRRAYTNTGNLTADCDNPASDANCFSAANFFNQGTALISFSDAATGKTWGLAQVRKFLDGKKVQSYPHLLCTNNHKAEIKIMEERLALDQGSGSTGGTTTQTRKWIPAALSVTITPRISSAETITLDVVIDINQFDTSNFTNADPNTANQITRNVTTRANVQSGHILALGGLTRVDTSIEQLETPLLGKIPIIGWFFKDRTNTTNKNNLTVFISPTIIEPRVRGGVSTYTQHHVQLAKSYSREGMLFDNLRDPITRWFFRTKTDDAATDLDDFIAQDEFIAPTIFDVRKEKTARASNETHKKNDEPQALQKTTVVAAAPISKPGPTGDLKTMVASIDNPFEKKAGA